MVPEFMSYNYLYLRWRYCCSRVSVRTIRRVLPNPISAALAVVPLRLNSRV